MIHKSEDYKLSAVEYYLTEDISQEQLYRIFKCNPRSLMCWIEKYIMKTYLRVLMKEIMFMLNIKQEKLN